MTTPDGQSGPHPGIAAAQDEVATIVQGLIRIDSSNFGSHDGPGELEAALFSQQQLADVGIDSEVFTTTAEHRAGVIARIHGANPDRPALLLHGHLDVVPAPEPDWSHGPFSGDIDENGVLWGRGAVDMKDMDGMCLAVIRHWARDGVLPDRDIVFLLLPDEEAGGHHGSHWLVENRPEIFEGVTEAVGEVGGFSSTIAGGHRLYPIQTAEKGIAWLKISTRGTPGHGSLLRTDNAVARLCAVGAQLGHEAFDVELTPTVRDLLDRIAVITGKEVPIHDHEAMIRDFGALGPIILSTTRHTTNLTMLDAGYKQNVVPEDAHAYLDGRFLPGKEDEFLAEIDRVLGDHARREYVNRDIAVETTFDGPTIDAMCAALAIEDPDGIPVPYLMSGGTDAKAFSAIGIRCYGFSPLALPPELDFMGMFHAVNERVPVDALKFGVRVLDRFLRSC